MPEPFPVSLTNCDAEPIHIPGSIQPHGCMVVVDRSFSLVLRHSLNAATMLGYQGDLNGASCLSVFGETVVHDLRNALTRTEGSRPALVLDTPVPSMLRFDIAIHASNSEVIVEFEPAAVLTDNAPLPLVAELVSRVTRIQDPEALLSQVPRHLRAVLGYDRVMVYKFEYGGAGKVISEAKRADLESFLGQYFPASDIPQQARALYLKNTIRVISDACYERVAVVPDIDARGQPLDLSHAHLRSVSPIHCEYLQNMGVVASMSISIIIDGALWGLIACHHYSAKPLSMTLRIVAAMFGEFISLHLSFLRQQRKLVSASNARTFLDRILANADGPDIRSVLEGYLPEFASIISCDGYALYFGGKWTFVGSTPPETALPELLGLVSQVAVRKVWATHSLHTLLPTASTYAGAVAGFLTIPMSQLPRDYLFLFRKELLQTLDWAGDPNKSYDTGPNGDRLTPRKSFAIWKQSVRGQSKPWTEVECDVAESTRAILVEIFLRHNELLTEERSRSDVRQRILNEELNHRVKNILAIIKSLAGQPVPSERPIKEFLSDFQGRIQALANAHDQVIRGDGGGLFTGLLEAEVSAYRSVTSEIALNGPDLWMDARAFSVFALVLHELATNAAKYGSLSQSGGRLDVNWHIDDKGDFILEWRESGGPVVAVPTRQGFGTALLTRSVTYDLDGESSVDYDPGGLKAHFRVPGQYLKVALRGSGSAPTLVPAYRQPASEILPSTNIFLVEDQMLIAMDVELMLQQEGFKNVTTANNVTEALHLLGSMTPDIAILDVNLGGGSSIPIAEELVRRKVPFIFATGYSDTSFIPDSLRSVPVARKPYDAKELLVAMSRGLHGPLSDDPAENQGEGTD
ncbi:HWE histidine kinase domain-containing protein [Agrobacterium vitis]